MANLTDLQLVLLSAAAQRDGGALLPLPKRLRIEAGALTRVLNGLLKRKLVAEQPAPPDAPAWRKDDDRRFILVIVPAGLDAIGVEPGAPASKPATDGKPDADKPGQKPERKSPKTKPEAAPDGIRPSTKELSRRPSLGRGSKFHINDRSR